MNAQLSSVPVGLGSTLFFRCRWWAPSVWHVWFAFIFACVSGGSLCGVRNHGLFVLFCAFLWDTALFLLVFCVRCLVWHLINSHDFSFFFWLLSGGSTTLPPTGYCPLPIDHPQQFLSRISCWKRGWADRVWTWTLCVRSSTYFRNPCCRSCKMSPPFVACEIE